MTWFPASTPPGPEIGDVLGATAAGYREVVHYHQSGVWMSSAGQLPIAWWCEIPAAPNPWLGEVEKPAERTADVEVSTTDGAHELPTHRQGPYGRSLVYRRRVPGAGAMRAMQGKA